jgi:Na+/H+ antiporter NhaD/arsenite permease-like protein
MFHRYFKVSLLVLSGLLLVPEMHAITFAAAGGDDAARSIPIWMVIPFVGILLSIALGPLVNLHWWEHNQAKVSLFWAAAFFLPYTFMFGISSAVYASLHIYVIDYIPFIILLGGLFIISGGIVLRGSLKGTPIFNTGLILIGTLMASLVGTTGASMLLIRPIIRANEFRKIKMHTIIFFIFLVSNIGGSLTPLGDPPLFLGFLHGVPFFWTLKLFWPFVFCTTLLLITYYAIDSHYFRQEPVLIESTECDAEKKEKISIGGLVNFALLGGVIAAIVLSGTYSKHPLFFDAAHNSYTGIGLMTERGHTLVFPYINLLRDSIIILMAILSWKLTPAGVREANHFTWGPIKEVAVLFAGIFLTIVPPMAILQARGAELGVTKTWQFFWATGVLSSFLDNAPTYLTFLSVATGLGATSGVVTDMGIVPEHILLAISCGAVFMGANSYIGNAPNFMVKSIAEENQIKMPSFFGYMVWSAAILIPIFAALTFVFFR